MPGSPVGEFERALYVDDLAGIPGDHDEAAAHHSKETGLVGPSARSQGGFRLYTEVDVRRLMVIRRMKPLGFTLDEMRDLLEATDRLDSEESLSAGDRDDLLERVHRYEQAATA
jgi:DNA-binding transcriptional MerR regulator